MTSLTSAQRGCLVLADISGYTNLLLSSELEHAEDALNDLLGRVVESMRPVLTLSKLEGDAAFTYVLAGAFTTSTLLDTVDRAYDAFRRRLRDIQHGTTCTCNACRQLPGLDLKFLVHDGEFVRRGDELVGADVILVHRLLKNSAAEILGTRGYLLLTQACVDTLGLDPEETGLQRHLERYDDVGEVVCWLQDLRRRWDEEQARVRVRVEPGEVSFERLVTLPLPREAAWDWLTAPSRQCQWKGDQVTQVAGGGRQGPGTTNHCLHGDEVTVEEIVDWKPFAYYTARYDFPVVGPMLVTYEVGSSDARTTTLAVRGEPFAGERLERWREIAPMIEGAFAAALESLLAATSRAAEHAVP